VFGLPHRLAIARAATNSVAVPRSRALERPWRRRALPRVLAYHVSRPAVVAAVSYLVIVQFLWLPFGLHTGMGWDTTIVYRSDTVPFWDGFIYVGDPLRKFTDVFYQVSYVLGNALGFSGSWIPFHVVYAALWWARGFLAYLIFRRLFPSSPFLAYVVGALTIAHASDRQLNLIGQLNQFGMVFWMLLALYFLTRALTDRRVRVAGVWIGLAALMTYMALWSYESPLFILVLAPPLILFRLGWTRRNLAITSAFYVVPLIYTIKTLQRYIDHRGGQYQESVLRKDMSLVPIARDLKLNLVSTVNFPSWGNGLPSLPRPFGPSVIALAAASAAVFLIGAVLTAVSGRDDGWPTPRRLAILTAAAAALVVASFPAYVVLESATQLYRTQILSGPATALFLTAICATLLSFVRDHRVRRISIAIFGAAVMFFGTVGAYATGKYFNILWERHRQVVAEVVEAAPQVEPGTVVVVTGVSQAPDPFGDNMWFDFAMRLAYKGVPVAGQYFYAGGQHPPGASLELRNGVWRATGQGFPTLFTDAPVSHTVVVQYRPNGHPRLLRKLPPFLAQSSNGATYAPLRMIDGRRPREWAMRRYG
jgi:hypothetical protein